ncbi:hypothetical protein DFH01_12655 [Falsiroseomonas bella]|uniref:YjiS-like domain-containing protein n=1 Tax=Falsiroseomonas bella TaxID=2184016 RepID=A0A317FF10_9PROT|nr:DUF1127 domain-containing protein [Falsiroseomonas bella]PWS37660.1 hypothetical protein DFH01_12655 [Falsiroseomonas bella]
MSGHVLTRPVLRRRQRVSAGWLAWLAAAMHAIESRRRLAEMDDRMLQDIGISRADALEEAARAPWDLKPNLPGLNAPWQMR